MLGKLDENQVILGKAIARVASLRKMNPLSLLAYQTLFLRGETASRR
jgi:hypothetical protein